MGEYICRGRLGEPKVIRQRRDGWTAKKRETFLNHLAATCNVRASCAAAGTTHHNAYRLRRRDAAFAEQWRAALLTGYDTLEAALIEHAMRALHLVDHDDPDELPPFNAEIALNLWQIHHAQIRAGSGARPVRGGTRIKRATEEETNAVLQKQLDVLDRRAKAEAARAAKGRR